MDAIRQESNLIKNDQRTLSTIVENLAGKIKLLADFDEKVELRKYFEKKHL